MITKTISGNSKLNSHWCIITVCGHTPTSKHHVLTCLTIFSCQRSKISLNVWVRNTFSRLALWSAKNCNLFNIHFLPPLVVQPDPSSSTQPAHDLLHRHLFAWAPIPASPHLPLQRAMFAPICSPGSYHGFIQYQKHEDEPRCIYTNCHEWSLKTQLLAIWRWKFFTSSEAFLCHLSNAFDSQTISKDEKRLTRGQGLQIAEQIKLIPTTPDLVSSQVFVQGRTASGFRLQLWTLKFDTGTLVSDDFKTPFQQNIYQAGSISPCHFRNQKSKNTTKKYDIKWYKHNTSLRNFTS